MLALPPADVGLIGALHEVGEEEKHPDIGGWRASIEEYRCTDLSTAL
jgi:hypothetical protein